jgi:hypothetical protein
MFNLDAGPMPVARWAPRAAHVSAAGPQHRVLLT